MNKEQILNLFTDDVEARRAIVAAYLADHTNPYEDRKEVFMNTPEHLYTTESFILSLPEYEDVHGELDWFDDFNKSKYEEIDLTQVSEWISYVDIKAKDDFVKAVVNMGVHSFTLDW